jgi:hypothetical protein
MSSLLLKAEQFGESVEVDIEKALSWVTKEGAKISQGGPRALAALAVVLSAVEKALADGAAIAANPTTLVLNFGQDIADVKAVWSDVKTFVDGLGIKL